MSIYLLFISGKQDKLYLENPEASVAILKKISEDWKDLHVKLAPLDPLRQTVKNFRQKVDLPYALYY